jgi:intracellular sulfur oxidation DsrE/DsrF family protein
MSWVDRITAAPYKVVVDSTKIEGDALYTAADVMDTFHEVYNTPDDQTRVVVVMRHFGAAMGLSDAIWNKYAIGEERTVTDPLTKSPARRNIFLRAALNDKEPWELNSKIEPLMARGVTILVCNRAAMGLASTLAKKANKPLEEVQADVKAGLVPGAYLMPNGVFAIIRAQNAGCAFYRNT